MGVWRIIPVLGNSVFPEGDQLFFYREDQEGWNFILPTRNKERTVFLHKITGKCQISNPGYMAPASNAHGPVLIFYKVTWPWAICYMNVHWLICCRKTVSLWLILRTLSLIQDMCCYSENLQWLEIMLKASSSEVEDETAENNQTTKKTFSTFVFSGPNLGGLQHSHRCIAKWSVLLYCRLL